MTVAFDNTNTFIQQASGNPLSGAQTVNAGSNLGIIVYVVWNDQNEGITITTVKYNGVTMTSLGARVRVDSVIDVYLQMFALANSQVATGSNTLEVTFSSANAIRQGAILNAYTGVDQTTPIRAGSYTSFSGVTAVDGTKALVVTSQTDDMTATGIASNDATPTTTQTLRTADQISGNGFIASDDAVATGNMTHTWDVGAVIDDIAMVGASLAAASGPSATLTPLVGAAALTGIAPQRVIGTVITPATP